MRGKPVFPTDLSDIGVSVDTDRPAGQGVPGARVVPGSGEELVKRLVAVLVAAVLGVSLTSVDGASASSTGASVAGVV